VPSDLGSQNIDLEDNYRNYIFAVSAEKTFSHGEIISSGFVWSDCTYSTGTSYFESGSK